jgi:predicted RNA-binding Zn-ribbon protein involved in translation (DUF1610 family)
MSQPTGFPCPECGDMIPVTRDLLLGFRDRVFCPNCGLQLTLNRDKSQQALREYQHLEQVVQKSQGEIDRSKQGCY